ncbi:hypothetical protein VPBG_00082 [Vibrio phage helene 12B3]|uniref:endonuclease n=1 Tax=Vibrio phage helene 12B3 TaxID=573173 RepID=UPI0002C0DDCF|nr:endonuclease [Vibrio phage helene 12B3]AGG57854.1 hypothetical protein VPBG_00082 [Vibrio phage helene 12B3]
MASSKKVYQVGDKLIFDGERFFIYEGELVGKYCKIFRTHCNICANSDNVVLRDAMIGGKFTVALPQAALSLRSNTFPCGCSPRIERLSQKLGIDIFKGNSFTSSKGTTITIGGRTSEGFRQYHCSSCSEDEELFPTPLEDKTSRLIKGKSNCGCSFGTKWTPQQNEIKVSRKCVELGYIFLGWAEKYTDKNTKCKISCPEHGEYVTCSIDNLLRGRSCPLCACIRRGEQNGNQNGYYEHRKDEEVSLYLFDIKSHLKVGRSFNIYDRSRSIFLELEKGFTLLKTYQGKHEDVYDIEQALLKLGRKENRRRFLGWTGEALTLDSKGFVEDFLEPYITSGKLVEYSYKGKLHNSCKKEA